MSAAPEDVVRTLDDLLTLPLVLDPGTLGAD
jgi:hypothetical protein